MTPPFLLKVVTHEPLLICVCMRVCVYVCVFILIHQRHIGVRLGFVTKQLTILLHFSGFG